jgi:hypothetical protein
MVLLTNGNKCSDVFLSERPEKYAKDEITKETYLELFRLISK